MEISLERNKDLYSGQNSLKKIRFPLVDIYDNGDRHFENLWRIIDQAEDSIIISMYHFDSTSVGNITMQKLTNACRRGVKVALMHDVLVSNVDSKLAEEFQQAGGRKFMLGEYYRVWRIWNRKYFKRDHEKLVVADNKYLLGSANISSDYGADKHGNNFFNDLNVYSENVRTEQVFDFLHQVADFHEVQLHESKPNHEYFDYLKKKFPSS